MIAMRVKCFTYILVLCCCIGCMREELTENKVVSISTVDTRWEEMHGTKALLENGNTIAWEADDEIGIFSDIQDMVVFHNITKEGKPTSSFAGDKVSGSEIYAIYPADGYDPSNRYVLNYNSVQPFTGESPKIRMPMVAKLENGVLHFKQTMGILHFTFKGATKIVSVDLRGNDRDVFSGRGEIDIKKEDPIFIVDPEGYGTNMTFSPQEPYTIEEGETWDVYFPVPPMVFEDGLYITVRCIKEGQYVDLVKRTDRSITVPRAGIRSFTVTDLAELIVEQENELEAQREALIAFYKATGGDQWRNNTNWCSDKPLFEWYGLSCDGDYLRKFVSQISLRENNLTGKIDDCIKQLTHLEVLDASDNNLSEVDLSFPNNLNSVLVQGNPVTEMDLSGCSRIKTVIANNTLISSLDVSMLKHLEWLECERTQISELNVTNNTKLKSLKIGDCGLEELDISHNPELFQLICDGNKLSEINLSQSEDLETISMVNNNLSSIDLTACPKLKQVFLGNNLNLQEIVFGDHPDLYNLDVNGAPIQSLDVSSFPGLQQLGIGATQVSSINLDNNLELWFFACPNTRITSIDVSKLTKLKNLCIGDSCDEVPEDFYSSIDVSNNPELEALQCWGTKESTLDLSKCLKLKYVELQRNARLNTIVVNPGQTFICNKDCDAEFVFEGEGTPPYASTDYSKDRTVSVLQEATKGAGIDLILMGDGFTDRLHEDGTYAYYMNYAMEAFFAREPYKSFRDMFNVYSVNVVSQNEVYSAFTQTKLVESFDVQGYPTTGRADVCVEYAKCALSEEKIGDATIVVLVNNNSSVSTGIAVMAEDLGIAFVTIDKDPSGDSRNTGDVIRHECGHAFAKLADEYAQTNTNVVQSVTEDFIQDMKSIYEPIGFYKNIDVTNDPTLIKWHHFLEDERYSGSVGIFEGGGAQYLHGVYRPSLNSIMNTDNAGVFNAPSREAIYYRIHKLAYGPDWIYSFDDFLQYDAINRGERSQQAKATTSMAHRQYVERKDPPLAQPVVIPGRWRDYNATLRP